jgi:hypothetical protein
MNQQDDSMNTAAPLVGTIFGASATWGAAIWQWLDGAGLINPASIIAFLGALVGFVANYPKLRTGAPQLWADLTAVYQRIRGRA